MPVPSHSELNAALVPLALDVGNLILEYYAGDVEISRKSDDSPVTLADREAEKLIIETLEAKWPDLPIVAEEMCAAGDIPKVEGNFFLVDPLDGTKEFINKRDEFTINIALIANNHPFYGLVLTPALGELFITLSSTEAGYKKYSNGIETLSEDMKAFEPSHFTPITVRDWPSTDPVGVISRSHMDEETAAFLNENKVSNRISAGSSLKFCQLSQGLADIYPRFGPTMEWDTAAGHSILCAAGGKLVDGNGEPFLYGKYERKYLNGNFVAAAKNSFDKIKF